MKYEIWSTDVLGTECAPDLQDEVENLAIPIDGTILAIADLGLWDGRRFASVKIKMETVGEILATQGDSDAWVETWGLDEHGDLCYDYCHHDGRNRIIFREIKPDVSPERVENLRRKIAYEIATRRDITRLTSSLGSRIKNVYGW